MTAKRQRNPTLDAEVERAMKPYRKLLPPPMQRVFEDILIRALTEDPTGKALLDKVRLPPLVADSGDVPKEGVPSSGRKPGGAR